MLIDNLPTNSKLRIYTDETLKGEGLLQNNPIGLVPSQVIPSQDSHSGQFLTTDGESTSWASIALHPSGSNTEIQFNNGGAFGSSPLFSWSNNSLTILGGLILSSSNTEVDPSGVISVPAWATKVTVKSKLCSPSSTVFTSIRTESEKMIKSTVPEEGSFTIFFTDPDKLQDISVGYLIIN